MTYLTTTKLSEKLGVDSKRLFDQLNKWGWIEKKDKRWVLTDLGKEKGGQTRSAPEIGEFVVWPEDTQVVLQDSEKHELNVFTSISSELKPQEISEGEEYIAEYFDEINMQYDRQYVIEKLNDKYAAYRIADFYLPKYQVMVEFAGRWNRSSRLSPIF